MSNSIYLYNLQAIMINSYYTILKIVQFLNQKISGKKIMDVFSDNQNQLFILYEQGAVIIKIHGGKNYIYWQEHFKHKPTPHFARFNELKKSITNHVFLENNERVVCFFLSDRKLLKIYLFPPFNNVILLTGNYEIAECYYEQKHLKYRDNYIKKYVGVRTNLLPAYMKFSSDFELKEQLYQINPALTQKKILSEMQNRILIAEKENLDFQINQSQAEVIKQIMVELNSSVLVLSRQETPYIKFTGLFPFIPTDTGSKFRFEYFEDPNKALQIFINSKKKIAEFENILNRVLSVLKSRKKYFQTTLKKLNNQLRQADKKEKYIYQANLILWNLHHIEKGDKSPELVDYNSQDLKKVKVKLDGRMAPKEYADHLFAQAKKMEDLGRIKHKIKSIEKSFSMVNRNLHKLDNITDLKNLKTFINRLQNDGIAVDLKAKSANIFEKRKIYREYIYNNYLIRVGKSAQESDRLTFKESKKWDWFFHTQGVTGSHVVVSDLNGKKLESLPPEILNVAGIIAAYYSDAKNSSSVPVQYTPIRFLRKAKGSPAGLVVFNRYKSIFVEPLKFQKLDFR